MDDNIFEEESQEPQVKEEKEPEVKEENTQQYNAHLTSNYYTQLPKDFTLSYNIALPSIPLKDFTQKIRDIQRQEIEETLSQDWKEVQQDSVEYYTLGSMYQDRFTDPSSSFEQGITDKSNQNLTIQNVKFRKAEGELKGEVALLKVSKLLGIGDVFSIPLPHSGIWVTIKPPAEADLIDFYNSLFREKAVLGRATSGASLTNYSVYINNKLFDFIIKHVHSVNYSDISKEDLKNKILIHDLPILEWGLGCTMFPNGFEFQRGCISDPAKCSYVAKGVINPTKLLWVDNSALTEQQKQILLEYRPNKLTVDSYTKYITDHARVAKSSFVTKAGIKFHLKVPTVLEHTTDGMNWVNKVNSAIESTVTQEISEKERVELLNQYIKASSLRQYSHFIDYIEVEESTIQDRDTINKVLETLSSDDDIRQEINKNIQDYMSSSTIALIGIPEYDCPSCGVNQNPNPVSDRLVNVIPLDVLNLFFTLITLRISKIVDRQV